MATTQNSLIYQKVSKKTTPKELRETLILTEDNKQKLALRVGVVFTLYTLYFTQAFSFQRVRIYIPTICLNAIKNTVKHTQALNLSHDTLWCVQHLVTDTAFVPYVQEIHRSRIISDGRILLVLKQLLYSLGERLEDFSFLDNLRAVSASYGTLRRHFKARFQKPELTKVNMNLSSELSALIVNRKRIIAHILTT